MEIYTTTLFPLLYIRLSQPSSFYCVLCYKFEPICACFVLCPPYVFHLVCRRTTQYLTSVFCFLFDMHLPCQFTRSTESSPTAVQAKTSPKYVRVVTQTIAVQRPETDFVPTNLVVTTCSQLLTANKPRKCPHSSTKKTSQYSTSRVSNWIRKNNRFLNQPTNCAMFISSRRNSLLELLSTKD